MKILTTNIKFNYWKKTTYVYRVAMSSAAIMAPSRLKEPMSSHLGVGESALNTCALKQIKSSTSDSKLNLLEIMIFLTYNQYLNIK